jgi:hypothetical protein
MPKPDRHVTWYYWPLQFGGAFTMPWGGRTVILARRPTMYEAEGYQSLRVHERVHADQIERWGAKRYIFKVMIWDRLVSLVRHGNLYAKDSQAEVEAYGEAASFITTGHSKFDDEHYTKED